MQEEIQNDLLLLSVSYCESVNVTVASLQCVRAKTKSFIVVVEVICCCYVRIMIKIKSK